MTTTVWPFAVNFSSDGGASFKTYYYVLNLQGDVVKLVNSSGTTAAQYTYDAWGTVTSILNANGNEIVNNTSGSAIAFWNPLTYRGYIRDIETGFYYLQSRYYDPVLHRFINADLPEYTTLSSVSTASANLFAYCVNNPVNLHDENGEWPSWAKKLVAVVAVAAAVVTATSSNRCNFWCRFGCRRGYDISDRDISSKDNGGGCSASKEG